jgi:hypothetical protein
VPNDDGTLTEQGSAGMILWVRDAYVDFGGPGADLLDCVNCGRRVSDTEFFVRIDSGEIAHVWCVADRNGNGGSPRIWARQEGM